MTEKEFETQYLALTCQAMSDAKNNDRFRSAIVETMARSLGRTIALMCHGNQKAMSDFLDGAIHYAENEAAGMQKAGQFLGDPNNWRNADGTPWVETPVATKRAKPASAKLRKQLNFDDEDDGETEVPF
jgi:hypothetical protein